MLSRRRRLASSSRKRWSSTVTTALCAKKTTPPLPGMQSPLPFPNAPSSLLWSQMSYSSSNDNEASNFSRYSKFLVKNSNGVDGLGKAKNNGDEQQRVPLVWVDTLGEDDCASYQHEEPSSSEFNNNGPRPFSVLSWNVLAQSLYEAQYQRRRIQQVALSQQSQLLSPTSSASYHPHPWPKRSKRIIEILSYSNSDIICLQECELQSFKDDLAPAMSKLGYDCIAQEDDRTDMPTTIHQVTKHRDARNHIGATFWKRDKFEPVGDVSVRTRTMTTVLRLRGTKNNNDDEIDNNDKEATTTKATPTVAVVNVHLEGHPRRFSERTHQLQHAMLDISKRIEDEKQIERSPSSSSSSSKSKKKNKKSQKKKNEGENDDASKRKQRHIGKLNALVLAGDFNCELQSSACSTYLRMGRLGRTAALGGVKGEDSVALPPSLLESTEATEVIHPIIEWGRALPEEVMMDVKPHPFRRNGMTSAYPAYLGKDNARSHFTFCSELSKRPVPGLDQLWFSSMTLKRKALRRMFVDDAGLWERYFYDENEVEKRREEERLKVLAGGLPSMECKYPSDHLPIGAVFEWKWEECGDSCLLDGEYGTDHCVDGAEVRGLNVVNSEGNNVQDDSLNENEGEQKNKQSFENPHDELDYLLHCCPFDSEEQQSDVQFILSELNPPLELLSKERPTPDQMEQLEARRLKKAELLAAASLAVRPWLKDIWKVNKQVGKWDRQREIERTRELEKSEV